MDTEGSSSGNMGIPSPMVYGVGANSKRSQKPVAPHPLEVSEKTFSTRQEQLEFYKLRKTMGLHIPLQMKMERQATTRNGHLPFLPRSNASFNSLTGQDELMTFEDYLGHVHEPEIMGQPHATVEKQLGLL